jgi:hypothetical protein
MELVSLCDETIAECFRALTAVAGNEGYNVVQIITGGRRPNQFVSNEANCFLISS